MPDGFRRGIASLMSPGYCRRPDHRAGVVDAGADLVAAAGVPGAGSPFDLWEARGARRGCGYRMTHTRAIHAHKSFNRPAMLISIQLSRVVDSYVMKTALWCLLAMIGFAIFSTVVASCWNESGHLDAERIQSAQALLGLAVSGLTGLAALAKAFGELRRPKEKS